MSEPEPPPRPAVDIATLPGTRELARFVFSLAALIGLLYALYVVRSVVLLVFAAGFLALALGPAVDRLERLGLPRAAAILLIYVGLVGIVVGIGLLVVPPVVDQIDQLAQDAPGYLSDLRSSETFRHYDDRYGIVKTLNQQAASLPSRVGDAASALSAVTVEVFAVGVQLITVLTMTFFLVLDGRRLVEFAVRAGGPRHEDRMQVLARDIYKSTAGYVAGALTLGTTAGLTALLVLTILGTPFAVPLAVLMFFLDLVPLVGATIAGVIIGVVTAFTGFPGDLIVWGIFFLIYQQIENNVLQPFVYRRAVSVAPLLVIVSILIGATLLGVLGALVAIPVAAALQIIIRDLWRRAEMPVAPPDGDSGERLEREPAEGERAAGPAA